MKEDKEYKKEKRKQRAKQKALERQADELLKRDEEFQKFINVFSLKFAKYQAIHKSTEGKAGSQIDHCRKLINISSARNDDRSYFK